MNQPILPFYDETLDAIFASALLAESNPLDDQAIALNLRAVNTRQRVRDYLVKDKAVADAGKVFELRDYWGNSCDLWQQASTQQHDDGEQAVLVDCQRIAELSMQLRDNRRGTPTQPQQEAEPTHDDGDLMTRAKKIAALTNQMPKHSFAQGRE